ncbi:MAG TPA: methyltransferase domain-containing protein [Puia sp.]|nr:methyltransferase domain-containing protein [Puia sp.]
MTKRIVYFGGEISQNYEDYLGSFVFEPFAVDLASRINWTGVGQVLELACGSGRLTKYISEQLPLTVAFTATDLNEDMIGVAKGKVPNDRVKWAPADMQDLPFQDGSFDLVVCQFGLMLVPDQIKALSEIFRVLKPGGKILFSTWTDLHYNRLWAIGSRVIQSIVGISPIEHNPGPFALDDKSAVEDMLKRTGFGDIQGTVVTNTGKIESAEKAAFGFIYGLPVSLFIEKEKPGVLPIILQTLEEKLKEELGDHPLRVPQKALVIEAERGQ